MTGSSAAARAAGGDRHALQLPQVRQRLALHVPSLLLQAADTQGAPLLLLLMTLLPLTSPVSWADACDCSEPDVTSARDIARACAPHVLGEGMGLLFLGTVNNSSCRTDKQQFVCTYVRVCVRVCACVCELCGPRDRACSAEQPGGELLD